MLRSWGEEQRYRPTLRGFNYRLPSIQAAILRVKLRRLEAWTEARRERAKQYDRLLENSGVTRPRVLADARHVYCLYTIRAANRETLQKDWKRREYRRRFTIPSQFTLCPLTPTRDIKRVIFRWRKLARRQC